MNPGCRSDERGMALALAIFALIVVGALVAGAFMAGHLEQRSGRSTLYAAQAADAAEAGAAETVASWDAAVLNALPPGDTVVFPSVPLGGRTAFRASVTRLNTELFLIQSLGSRANADGGTLARRTIGVVARLASLGAGPAAALTVSKFPDIVGDQVMVSGSDSEGVELPGCPPGPSGVPIRIAQAASASYAVFGDVTFDRLKAHASVVLPDTTLLEALHPSLSGTGHRCDTDEMSNWGEPRRSPGTAVESCRTYYPIVYANGSRLSIAGGGRGQGVLLVEGDLDISGNFDFTGLIVVKGGVRTSGARIRITGALMAANAAGSASTTLAGGTTIHYSSCGLHQALTGAAFAEPLGQRSWVQVY